MSFVGKIKISPQVMSKIVTAAPQFMKIIGSMKNVNEVNICKSKIKFLLLYM
jgi:hypothetical protein